MRRGIVFKLFMLTTALCVLILATIFIGQTIFFKQFYINKKVSDIRTNLKSFEINYLNSGGNAEAKEKLEQDYYLNHNTWVTTLDSLGNITNANDFSLEVKYLNPSDNTPSDKHLTIPLYGFKNIDDTNQENSPIKVGDLITFQAINKDSIIVPYRLIFDGNSITWENNQIVKKENRILPQIDNESKAQERISNNYPGVVSTKPQVPNDYLYGTITKIQIPDGNKSPRLIYTNHTFIDRIKEFQANLLLDTKKDKFTGSQTISYEENDIKYKIFINSIKEKDGGITYVFAMSSMQPVDEAIQMIENYFVYLIIFVMVLILLASFYYSKRISRPLLKINNITKKIANLDFSEKIPVTLKDEIGDLSRNINELSDTMHSHIEQLEQDVEKEKQLENTRKEFISGVSHELKTPLTVIKSCISILKDDVATHKREYYFEAMEKEVDKMDMMIVDMLELAKFESGTYVMKVNSFYIDDVINDICDQLFLEMGKKQLHLYTELISMEVVANQHRIQQVVTNFITNAIRYTPDNEDIIISTIEENGDVKVSVENKGVHIPEEQVEKIWDRFYRGDTSRQRSKGGTGLGLAISKNILDLHGVQYGMSNTEEGVVFFFYLHKKV